MKAEEAIFRLKLFEHDARRNSGMFISLSGRHIELAMAIEALEKVEEYKRLEEQGLLLRLPCKVGDRYYRIRKTCSDNWLEPKGKYFPSNHYCVDFCPHYHNGCDGEYIVVEYVFETIGQIISNQKWLGEYLFLSRKEAEQKLKEMEDNA